MRTNEQYPAGTPCWIDTLQPDPVAAAAFYGDLFGWSFDPPGPMPSGWAGEYRIARRAGDVVGGIGQAPAEMPSAAWTTYVAVDDVGTAVAQAVAAGGTVLVPPARAGDDGALAVLADPAGVAVGLWQPVARKGVERAGEPGTWAISSLHTAASDEAAAFYGATFGWRRDPVPGASFAFWRRGGTMADARVGSGRGDVVALLAPIGPGDPTPPHWSVSFRVADVAATADRAAELGGTVLLAPVGPDGSRSAVLADPQGGVVAVTERDASA